MKKYFSKEKWKYLWYTLSHPMDGYYWIRRKDKGSVPIALLLVLGFSLCFSLNRYGASFVVNDVNPRNVNSLTELLGVALLYFLFCVGNWSVTCLMNGEGRLKDICTAVGYALLPLILCYIPATILSQGVAADEEAFYFIVMGVGIAWGALMLLMGIMQVHNYSLGKTIITLFLTLLAVFIIIFLMLLLLNLITQVYNFFYSIYTELVFRN
ncbi:MAG: YIP1 family protein [Lachnospiraceae bacterium]|nr:YIP1 family protein [Lachnospiraceae bacterium]